MVSVRVKEQAGEIKCSKQEYRSNAVNKNIFI